MKYKVGSWTYCDDDFVFTDDEGAWHHYPLKGTELEMLCALAEKVDTWGLKMLTDFKAIISLVTGAKEFPATKRGSAATPSKLQLASGLYPGSTLRYLLAGIVSSEDMDYSDLDLDKEMEALNG